MPVSQIITIDLDIKGFFDSIDHELLMKGVERFTQEKWILMCAGAMAEHSDTQGRREHRAADKRHTAGWSD